MKFRKVLSTLLVAAMLVGLVPVALAANETVVSLNSGKVNAGETVTLNVSVEGNPGLATCVIYVYYDTEVFTVDLRSGVKAAGTFQTSGAVIANSIEAAKGNGSYYGKTQKDGVVALWYNGTGVNTSSNGNMLTITLQIKAGAANGDYVVELDYSPRDTVNQDSELVRMNMGSAVVSVVNGSDNGSGGGIPDDGGSTSGGTIVGDVDIPGLQETYAFLDVPADHWAAEHIEKAADLGLILGYAGYYRPDDSMTRAECMTILWRASGSPKPEKAASFTDLDQDWYRDAVAWAQESGVATGIGNNLFDPYGNVTREQLVTFLHRMAGSPTGMEAMFSGVYDRSFSDSGKIGSWAKNSLYWSVYNVIYCGVGSPEVGSELKPTDPADRAQIAVMITRYLEET